MNGGAVFRALGQVQWGLVAAFVVAVPLLGAGISRLMGFGWSPLTALAYVPASVPGGVLLFGHFSFLQICLLMVVCGPLLNLPHHAWRIERQLDQEDRDNRAGEIARSLAAGRSDAGARPFAVYLRPFGSEDKLATQPYTEPSGEITQHIDFESLLQRALVPRLAVVALGAPKATQASGRVVASEASWRQTASLLIRNARLLLLLPSDRPGTVWELGTIVRERALDRTVLLMPETPRAGGSGFVETIGPTKQFGFIHQRVHYRDHASEWIAAQAAARGQGLELPDYDVRGAVFTMADDGSVRRTLPLMLTRRARKVRALRDILGQLGADLAP